MGFSGQEYWSGLPFASPGGLSDPGIVPTFLASPTLAGEFSTTAPSGKPCTYMVIPDDSPNPCMPHSEHWSLISEESSQLFLSVESSTWLHCKSAFLLSLVLLINILAIYQWKWNITQESTFQGCHTLISQKGLQQGQILFIMSEILFFFLLFLLWFLPPLSGIPASVYKYYSEVDISEGKFSFITEEWKPNWILPFLSFFLFSIGFGKY